MGDDLHIGGQLLRLVEDVEHGVAVAAAAEVAVDDDLVADIGIERRAVIELHVGNAAARLLCEVGGVGDAGGLGELAVQAGQGADTVFQRGEDRGAGGLDEHHVVVKGQDGVAGLQRDGTLGHGGADAAAVHEADVRLIDGEEVEQGVGDEVGDGRVLTADELRGPFKVLRAVADDLLQRGGDLVVIAVDKGLDGGILGVGIRQEDLTVDNAGHLAVQHDDVDLIQGFAMLAGVDEVLRAVDDGRAACDVVAAADGDVNGGIIGDELRVLAVHMGQRDDDIAGLLVLQAADKRLGRGQIVVPLDVIGVAVERRGSALVVRHAEDAELQTGSFLCDVVAEGIFLLARVGLAFLELRIGGEHGILCAVAQAEQVFQRVVKVVVAEHGGIEAESTQGVDGDIAHGDVGQRGVVGGVAAVDVDHMILAESGLDLIHDGLDAGYGADLKLAVAGGVGDVVAVDVGRGEHGDDLHVLQEGEQRLNLRGCDRLICEVGGLQQACVDGFLQMIDL